MSNIVKINHEQYGLQEQKASEIRAIFSPMLDRMVELEVEYNQVMAMPMNATTCQLAGELRNRYVKTRTGTAAIHKELKAFYLKGGRFVDAFKNAQAMAADGIEKTLIKVEKYYINQELERIGVLQLERQIILVGMDFDGEFLELGKMSDEVWDAFLADKKLEYKARIKAEKIKQQAEWQVEQDRLHEVAKLKVEKAELEKKNKIQRVKNKKLEADAEAQRAVERNKKMKAETLARAGDGEKLIYFAQQIAELDVPKVGSQLANQLIKETGIILNEVTDRLLKGGGDCV